MGSSETTKVGVFGARTPEAHVPSNMEGKTIWYSSKYKFFMITDENNQSAGEFDFKKYKEFVDIDVILFTTPGTEHHMARLLREWEAEQAMNDPFASFDALDELAQTDSSYQDFPQEQVPVRRSSRTQSVMDDEDILGDAAASKQKDPTRHIPVYMALTLIFTIIIIVAINFGQPIIQAVAPLLS